MKFYKKISKFFNELKYGKPPPPGLERERYYLKINIGKLSDQIYDVWCGCCSRQYACEHCDYLRLGLEQKLERKEERLRIVEEKIRKKRNERTSRYNEVKN